MIDNREINALAKGLVPFVRDVVTDAVTPLDARVAALEARPIEKGDKGEPGERGADGAAGERGDKGEAGDPGSILLPPELVDEVARAVRLLHESPPIVQQVTRAAPAPKITRIERDDGGNFVPIYDGARQ